MTLSTHKSVGMFVSSFSLFRYPLRGNLRGKNFFRNKLNDFGGISMQSERSYSSSSFKFSPYRRYENIRGHQKKYNLFNNKISGSLVSRSSIFQGNVNTALCRYNTCFPRPIKESRCIQLSSRAPGPEIDQVSPKVRQKNLVVAALCLLFVGGVYAYSIRKLKDDELSALEEEVININLHESGLKATKVKELLDEIENSSEKK